MCVWRGCRENARPAVASTSRARATKNEKPTQHHLPPSFPFHSKRDDLETRLAAARAAAPKRSTQASPKVRGSGWATATAAPHAPPTPPRVVVWRVVPSTEHVFVAPTHPTDAAAFPLISPQKTPSLAAAARTPLPAEPRRVTRRSASKKGAPSASSATRRVVLALAALAALTAGARTEAGAAAIASASGAAMTARDAAIASASGAAMTARDAALAAGGPALADALDRGATALAAAAAAATTAAAPALAAVEPATVAARAALARAASAAADAAAAARARAGGAASSTSPACASLVAPSVAATIVDPAFPGATDALGLALRERAEGKATGVLLAVDDDDATDASLSSALDAVAAGLPPACASCTLALDAASLTAPGAAQAALAPFFARCPSGVVTLARVDALPPTSVPALLAALGEGGGYETKDGRVASSGALVVATSAAPAGAAVRAAGDDAAFAASAKRALTAALTESGVPAVAADALRRRFDVVVPVAVAA